MIELRWRRIALAALGAALVVGVRVSAASARGPRETARVLAHSPTIERPDEVAVGPDGSIWVIDGPTAPRSRIVVLRGAEGDGEPSASVFLDGLIDARAVIPLGGARALVLEPPNLLLAQDANGDGRAERTDIVVSGLEAARGATPWPDGSIRFAEFGAQLRPSGAGFFATRAPTLGAGGAAVLESGDVVTWIPSRGLVLQREGRVLRPDRIEDARVELHLADLDGDALKTDEWTGLIAWSPDGRGDECAIASPANGTVAIVRIDDDSHASARALLADAGEPTALAAAPDGSLVVADRRGRILVVEPNGGAAGAADLADATTEDLGAACADACSATRDAARRLLRPRRVDPAIEAIAYSHANASVRDEALALLDTLGVGLPTARSLVGDADARVRQRSLDMLSRGAADDVAIVRATLGADDAAIRASAIASLARAGAQVPASELASAFARDGREALVREAIVLLARGNEAEVAALVLKDGEGGWHRRALLGALADEAFESDAGAAAMLACAVSAPNDDARAIVDRAAAAVRVNAKRRHPLELDRPVVGWTEFVSRHPDDRLLAALNPWIRWPGRADIALPVQSLGLNASETIALGRRLYATCLTCHGGAGKGQPGVYPPLAGSEIVNGDPVRFARILTRGLEGPLVVQGKTYNGIMPKSTVTDDEELAAIMTYVRQAFGNDAEPVPAALVREVRSREQSHTSPLKASELDAVSP